MTDHHDHHDDHGEHGDDYWVHSHIAEVKEYLKVLGTLLILTGVTVAIYPDAKLGDFSFGFDVRLGAANLGLAILIATVKASLVCYYFMHMKYEKKFNVIFFVGSVVFGGVFFVYTSNDTSHRGELDEYYGTMVDGRTGDRAAGGLPNCHLLDPPTLLSCESTDECMNGEVCNDGQCHWAWPCSWEEFVASESAEAEGAETEGAEAQAATTTPEVVATR